MSVSRCFALWLSPCFGFADDDCEGVDFSERGSDVGFAGVGSVFFADSEGISVVSDACAVESVAHDARVDDALGVELADDDDVLGVELAQNGRCDDEPSSSLRGFLRLLRFLHSSTSAL